MAMRHRGRPDPKSYTMPQVSRMLGFSDTWAYSERKHGRLNTFRNEDGEERVSADELLRFLETKTGRKQTKSDWHVKVVPDGEDDGDIEVEYDLVTRQTLKRLYSRAGGHISRAEQNPDDISARLQEGLRHTWEQKADPDGTLRKSNPAEFTRKVEHYRQAHMLMMAAESVKSGARRRAQKRAQKAKEVEEEEP